MPLPELRLAERIFAVLEESGDLDCAVVRQLWTIVAEDRVRHGEEQGGG